jgi:aldehyde dehydrogenase (NAD+)
VRDGGGNRDRQRYAYGLQAYVISPDIERARRVAQQIKAGRVLINNPPHDPMVPFGGFKQSGIGREYGVFGLAHDVC